MLLSQVPGEDALHSKWSTGPSPVHTTPAEAAAQPSEDTSAGVPASPLASSRPGQAQADGGQQPTVWAKDRETAHYVSRQCQMSPGRQM